MYGPIAGALIGFVGHTLIEVTSYGRWWSWIIASAVIGLIMGLAASKMNLTEKLDKKGIITFNVAQIIAHLVGWGVVAPCLDILIYSEPIEKLYSGTATDIIILFGDNGEYWK